VGRFDDLDLAQLIDIITQEVVAASRHAEVRCGCHAVNEDCCPSRLQGWWRGRGVRPESTSGGALEGVAGLIDHTAGSPTRSVRNSLTLPRSGGFTGIGA
jgi:hypothetical protein